MARDPLIETKRCTACDEHKPVTEYYKSSHGRGDKGLHSYCKPCCATSNKRYRDSFKRSVLYVIEHPTELGYTKVGVANNPMEKLGQYNYSSPGDLFKFHSLYEMEDPSRVEKIVLEHFYHKRPRNSAGSKGSRPRDWIQATPEQIMTVINRFIPPLGASHV